MQYDADEQPDAWLELDEAERIDLVIDYHRRMGVQLENPEPSCDRPCGGRKPSCVGGRYTRA